MRWKQRRLNMDQIPQNPSESTKRRNPHLYGVGALESAKPEPNQRGQSQNRPLEGSTATVGICIRLVSFRKKLLDDDNFAAGAKPLRDAIARSLAIDDADPRVKWAYSQVLTDGPHGVLVLISVRS
jgi:hypothetical protein